ncbi:hypothetical protein GCM10027610_065870 [Dactylosporangium cerinum]
MRTGDPFGCTAACTIESLHWIGELVTRADPARSVAILIGTTNHTQEPPFPLQDLPAVRNNVTQLFN